MKKLLVLLSLTAIILTACGGGSKEEPQEGAAKMTAQESQELLAKAKGIFVGPLPDKMPGSENDTPEMIALGEKLYHETKLSKGGNQSCNTCHDLNNAGQDSKPVSEGSMPGKIGRRNSNTVLNAGFQFAQFWDYRAADLVEQAKGPILNPDEMAMPSEKEVEKVISAVPEYVEMFAKAFPADKKPITYHNLARAIAAFERTLISKSRFDDYLGGNMTALKEEEKAGLKLFIESGCITCHTGSLLGGNIPNKMGLVKPYENTSDLGRFEVTKNEADKFMFKVAMLRNVTLTAPYFHDGKATTLDEAITKMGELNLGKTLTTVEVSSIKTFLGALTDKKLEKK